ncbi:MAG: flippase, partial [bacterium]|nr:flippase [bacterium]
MLKKLRGKLEKDFHLGELIRGSGQHFALQALGVLLTYLFVLLVTRTLGAGVYGNYTLALAVLNIVVAVGKMGLDTALVKFVSVNNARNRRDIAGHYYYNSLKLTLLSGSLLTVLLLLFSGPVSVHIFHKDSLKSYLTIAAFGILPFIFRNLNAAALRGLKKIKEFALVQFTFPRMVVLSIFCVFLAGKFWDGRITILSFVMALVLVTGTSFRMTVKEFKGLNRDEGVGNETETGYGEMLRTSLPMFMTDSLFLLMNWVNILMIGMLATEADVGVYGAAVRMALFTSLTLNAVNGIVSPKIAEVYGTGDNRGLEKIARQATKITFLTSFPILTVFLVFPKTVLSLFGGEFERGFVVLMMIAAGQFFNSICGSVGNILNMTGHQNIVKNVIFTGLLINIGLNLYLIPSYGINGAAAAHMVATVFWNLALTY